jgi:transposase
MAQSEAEAGSRPGQRTSPRRVQKKFPEQVAGIVAQRDPEDTRPVVIMSQDEGRFGRINDHRPCWAPKGMRPRAPRQIVRAFVYVYAAVCMALGKITSLILPYANTEMMNLFLHEVAEDFKDFFVIMLVDQAGWHKSKGLIIPQNIKMIPQPPHSPELNPVEHLWEDLRENAMPNAAFKSLDQVEQALCQRLVDLGNNPERLRSMTNFPYLRIT